MHDIIHRSYPGQRLGFDHDGTRVYGTTIVAEDAHNRVGGRWQVLTVELHDGRRVSIDTRDHHLVTEERTERAWCPQDRAWVEVEERSDEGHLESHGEVGYTVTHLSCGHHTSTPPTVVAAAPGAPYAGPRPVSPTAQPRDLVVTRTAAREAAQ